MANENKKTSSSTSRKVKSNTKSKTIRNKPADQSIVNVVKNECCPEKAVNPMQTSNTVSAYTKLAKDGNRFE